MKFLLLCMWAGKQIKEKYQNSCHLKTINQNNQQSNQHIPGINMHIQTKYEVSRLSMWAGDQIKVPKNLPLKNYKSE